jgi:hypothetical protein
MIDSTFKAGIALVTVLVGVAAVLPAQWRVSAKRAWSYGVYNVGYRMLSVQISCGNLAASGVPLVLKQL